MRYIFLLLLFGLSFANSTILSKNYTWVDFQTETEAFYDDWTPYIITIMTFALAFLTTKKYPETFLAGGVGLFTAFIMTSNVLFIFGAMFFFGIGFLYKQVGG